MAGPTLGIRLQRAHLEKVRHAALVAGSDQFLHKIHMHFTEATAVMTLLIQYAYKIDRGISPCQESRQDRLIVYIGSDDFDTGEDQKLTGAFAIPCWNADRVTALHELADKLPADEAGTTQDAYGA